MNPKVGAAQLELACAVAKWVIIGYSDFHTIFLNTNKFVCRIFESHTVQEAEVLSRFSNRLRDTDHATEKPNNSTPISTISKRPKYNREHLDGEPAKIGEQVAAKIGGTWILGCPTEYDASTDTYIVQDEDDVSRVEMLRWGSISYRKKTDILR